MGTADFLSGKDAPGPTHGQAVLGDGATLALIRELNTLHVTADNILENLRQLNARLLGLSMPEPEKGLSAAMPNGTMPQSMALAARLQDTLRFIDEEVHKLEAL